MTQRRGGVGWAGLIVVEIEVVGFRRRFQAETTEFAD